VELSEEQIERVFVALIGMPPRPADVQMVATLGGTTESLAEYIWDHWLGEPEYPTAADVEAEIRETL
jgi:hypothetical protein